MPPLPIKARQMADRNVLLGSAIIAGLCSFVIIWNHSNHQLVEKEKLDMPLVTSIQANNDVPAHIRDEFLSRVRSFFGDSNSLKLENAHVVVVGLGGVGSHAAHMLLRSGVSNIRLIDFDQVTLSSLNRHAVATMDDVGHSKAAVLASRLKKICPWANIEGVTEMFKASEADRLINGKPDYVLDCIDDVNTKAELIEHCIKNNIKVLTSMGAGGKADPTKLRIAPLSDCINDPLAAKIRWKMKKNGVAADSVMSVFSVEKATVNLLPLTAEQSASPELFGSVDNFRIRVIPVLGTSPSIFGQAMASYVLCDLAGSVYAPDGSERLSKHFKHRVRQILRQNEINRFNTTEEMDVDDDDIDFIVQTLWRSRCAVTGKRFGAHIVMQLTRWDPALPPTPDNLVLMQQSLADKMAKEGHAIFAADVVERIESRLQWAREACAGSWLLPLDTDNDVKVAARLARRSSTTPTTTASSSCGVPLGVVTMQSSSVAAVNVLCATVCCVVGYFIGKRGGNK